MVLHHRVRDVVVGVVVDGVIPAPVLTHVATAMILVVGHLLGSTVHVVMIVQLAQPAGYPARGGVSIFERFEPKTSPVASSLKAHETFSPMLN